MVIKKKYIPDEYNILYCSTDKIPMETILPTFQNLFSHSDTSSRPFQQLIGPSDLPPSKICAPAKRTKNPVTCKYKICSYKKGSLLVSKIE